MGSGHFTGEQREWLLSNIPSMQPREVRARFAERFGRGLSYWALRDFRRIHGLRSPAQDYATHRCGMDASKVYPSYRRAAWEHEHGPVPEGMVVVSEDGTLGNLRLITRRQSSDRCRLGLRWADAAALDACLALADLDRKVRERGRKNHGR